MNEINYMDSNVDDIDYDKIISSLNNENNKLKSDINSENNLSDIQNLNINNLTKFIESEIENYDQTQNQLNNLKRSNDFFDSDLKHIETSCNNENIYNYRKLIYNNKEIILYILLFILLNLNNEKIPIINKINNYYLNLIMRAIIFGLIIYCIKKYKILQ
jgi:hypothetical protein